MNIGCARVSTGLQNCVKTKIYLKQGECTELIVYENG
ncbi:hypothetical protein LLT7_13265 [Lactococcus cremoris subsp. cremoris TIFN7]|nr:hypothetical protein LLT7_13265 [Lactococcus cremoris subsp. cremoris TIFN7]